MASQLPLKAEPALEVNADSECDVRARTPQLQPAESTNLNGALSLVVSTGNIPKQPKPVLNGSSQHEIVVGAHGFESYAQEVTPCLNGYVPVHAQNGGVSAGHLTCYSVQPASLCACSVYMNGSSIHSHDHNPDNADPINATITNGQTIFYPKESSTKVIRTKKIQTFDEEGRQHSPGCVLRPSKKSDGENLGASSSENVLDSLQLCVTTLVNGVKCNKQILESPQEKLRGINVQESYCVNRTCQEPLSSWENDNKDYLDMVDEGAICDFDKNVPVDETSYFCFQEDMNSTHRGEVGACFQNGHRCLDEATRRPPFFSSQNGHHYSNHGQYRSSSDSESDSPKCISHVAETGNSWVGREQQDMTEDNGDFIDADLPTVSSRLLSSSLGSGSLSSSNGDPPELSDNHIPSGSLLQHENNLSVGSDKELNHRPDSPDSHVHDSAHCRTSQSHCSLGFEAGFNSHSDNFLSPEMSISDGVFEHSSESENDEEYSDKCAYEGHNKVTVFEGAGVAEGLTCSRSCDGTPNNPQFGAVGGLCFQFTSSCCVRENNREPQHMASCLPSSFFASQSDARIGLCLDPWLHSQAEGEAGGACAPPPPPVNNLSRLHSSPSGSRVMDPVANGFDDVSPSNFINDESNRQQKVFVKFPMVREDREMGCGSGAGQVEVKCENDNVLCPCPASPLNGGIYDGGVERGEELLQANLQASHGSNVESYEVLLQHFKHPSTSREMEWLSNSESGVSEPIYEEIHDYRACNQAECSLSHNTLSHVVKKGTKDTRKKRIICRPIDSSPDIAVEKVMIWNEYEAYMQQVKQIGVSACGQTAVLNLLKAFELPSDKDDVCREVRVSLRKEKATVAEYLASRAVAGTTAEDLLTGVERLTKGEVRGRFFHFWPPKQVHLLLWLSEWIKRGAVPVATLNLQQGVKSHQGVKLQQGGKSQSIPDAWHHQMVYGVGPKGVYLTNPLEIVSEETIMEQLTSDSVLLVRRQDVVSRFQPTANLAPLMSYPDPRWCSMNVLGQVVNVLREHNMPSVPGYRAQVTSHIRIPAVYCAGITLFARYNSNAWKALRDTPDLPLMKTSQDALD